MEQGENLNKIEVLAPQNEEKSFSERASGSFVTDFLNYLDDNKSGFLEDLKKLKEIDTSKVYDKNRVEEVLTPVEWEDRNAGFGYAAPSQGFDAEKELLATFLVAKAFKERSTSSEPISIPIDIWYRIFPGNPSFVSKTKEWDASSKMEYPEKDFALIVSGFSKSEIFTEKVLTDVPRQESAELTGGENLEFGNNLLFFAKEKLPALIEKNKGDLVNVLSEMAENQDKEDARLLLVTGLLLQDRQKWQTLWYENSKGTPLYIIAPTCFHDAMNRLNKSWGHGALDYKVRATLGSYDDPIFEEENNEQHKEYEKQGVSSEDFKKRVLPILQKYL